MSDSIEARLSSLRARQQEADRRYAAADAKLDQVKARKEQILGSLRDSGYETPAAARERVEALNESLESVLSDIEQKVSGL